MRSRRRPSVSPAWRTFMQEFVRWIGVGALGMLLFGATATPAQADEAEVHYRMGLQHKRAGRLDAAEREIREAVRLRPTHAAAHMSLGGVLRQTGRLEPALASYRRVIELEPTSSQAHALAGATLVRLRRYEEAIPYLTRATQ